MRGRPPVSTAISVVVQPTSAYAEVIVRPLAELDRSRHVLVVFGPEDPAAEAANLTDATAAEGTE